MKTKLLYGILAILLLAPFAFAQNSNLSVSQEGHFGKSSLMQVIRLELRTKKGVSREITVQFSDFTSTEGYDIGYDQRMTDYSPEDIYTYLNREKMVKQAYSRMTYLTVVPLAINTTGYYKYEILAIDFDNFERDTGVYLWDKYENRYFDLRTGKAYGFSSGFGEYKDRFVIIFKTNQKGMSDAKVFYNNVSDKLFVKGLESDLNDLTIYNMNGYAVSQFDNISSKILNDGLALSNLREGIYVVGLTDNKGNKISQKLIIN